MYKIGNYSPTNLEKNSINLVNVFRNYLSKIEDWGNQTIESETQRIIENSNCEWLDDLITAVFISRVKILTSINDNNNYNKINLTIPKTTNFIHKLYINKEVSDIIYFLMSIFFIIGISIERKIFTLKRYEIELK